MANMTLPLKMETGNKNWPALNSSQTSTWICRGPRWIIAIIRNKIMAWHKSMQLHTIEFEIGMISFRVHFCSLIWQTDKTPMLVSIRKTCYVERKVDLWSATSQITAHRFIYCQYCNKSFPDHWTFCLISNLEYLIYLDLLRRQK